jgi:hypothetical protein
MIKVHGQFAVNQLFQITIQEIIVSNQLEVKKTPKKSRISVSVIQFRKSVIQHFVF